MTISYFNGAPGTLLATGLNGDTLSVSSGGPGGLPPTLQILSLLIYSAGGGQPRLRTKGDRRMETWDTSGGLGDAYVLVRQPGDSSPSVMTVFSLTRWYAIGVLATITGLLEPTVHDASIFYHGADATLARSAVVDGPAEVTLFTAGAIFAANSPTAIPNLATPTDTAGGGPYILRAEHSGYFSAGTGSGRARLWSGPKLDPVSGVATVTSVASATPAAGFAAIVNVGTRIPT